MKKTIVILLLIFCVVAFMCSVYMLFSSIIVADTFNIILWIISTLGYTFFTILCAWGLSEIK